MKKCCIIWGGLKVGPIVVKSTEDLGDKSVPRIIDQDEEFEQLTFDMHDNIVQQGKTPSQLNDEMVEFLNSRGYDVTYSDYSEDAELFESLNAKQAKTLIHDLKQGKIRFKYKKNDGTIRTAVGTLKSDLMNIPDKKVDAARERRTIPNTILIYFDLDSKGFRSFRKVNFIKRLR